MVLDDGNIVVTPHRYEDDIMMICFQKNIFFITVVMELRKKKMNVNTQSLCWGSNLMMMMIKKRVALYAPHDICMYKNVAPPL